MIVYTQFGGKTQAVKRNFYIIEEFSALTARRKSLLCDQLFCEGYEVFERTVQLLWPGSSPEDTEKLANFMRLLRKATATAKVH